MDQFQAIINDVCELVRRHAHPRRNTIAVSPEVAALLDAIKTSDTASRLDDLSKQVAGCTKCELSKGRTQTVFGTGNTRAELVFVGEGPGAEEDRQGIPFVGDAGQMLTSIIERGIKVKREDVYICNVVKCRPPGNRNPKPDEMAACEPYLFQQLELIRPKVICALGATAASCLLRLPEARVGQLRGKWHWYKDIPVRVTYHPSYLVRQKNEPDKLQDAKAKVWADIRAVIRVLNGEEPPEP